MDGDRYKITDQYYVFISAIDYADSNKVVIAIGFMFGISLLCYLNSKKVNPKSN